MAKITASVEEQMSALMRGVEYGDANIQRTMEEDLRERLSKGRPLRVYAGFDPTGDLHLGHLIPILKLRQFQSFGHEVTFLMGTMTAQVGDPSDKSAARQMLTAEEVEDNMRTWLDQAYRVLDPEKTHIARNGDWLSCLTLAEVTDLASHFTVADFLKHETFRKRMDEGKPLYLHEFVYAMMQAYDAFTLKTDVQVGGTDQLFNILAGRQLQRALSEEALIAICVPLLKGTDGVEKMSKSLGNYIGLNETSNEMYGKLMSIPDSLLVTYYTHLTAVSASELSALETGLAGRSMNAMDAKKRLAYSVVGLLSGKDAADEAQAEFERVFQRREQPGEAAQDLALALDADGVAHVDITQLLVDYGLEESRGAARRLVQQGGVSVDDVKLTENQVALRKGAIIKLGRHRFYRVIGAS
jgi:tyrosyl-tRNA synthetase